MAIPKERKPDFCPKCFLETGIDNPLIFRLGSTQPLKCNKEHVFEDREVLSNLTREMIDTKKAKNPPKPVPTLDIVVDQAEPGTDKTVVTMVEIKDPTDPIPVPSGTKGINVSPIDFVRMSQIIGHFTDSSSLFGAIFAINQELNDTKELLRRAMDAKSVSSIGGGPGVRKIGGDEIIQVIIPERHVQPIRDIAESNGLDVTRYMNAKIEDGLDCQWYYVIPFIAIFGAIACQFVPAVSTLLV